MRLSGWRHCLLVGLLLAAGAMAAEINAPVVAAPAVGVVPAVAAAAAPVAPQQVAAVQPPEVAAAGGAAVAAAPAPVAGPAAAAAAPAAGGKTLVAEAVMENGTADLEFFLPYRKFDSAPEVAKSDAAPSVGLYPAPPPPPPSQPPYVLPTLAPNGTPATMPPTLPPYTPPPPPPVMPTLPPYVPPVESTPPPYVPPVESTPPPYVPPVESTPPPYVPPVESTPPPYVPPVESTPPPYVPPVESTPPPYVPPVESTPPPYVPPVESTPPPYVPPVESTPPPYVPPVESTPPPYVPPVESTPPPYVPPIESTPPPYVPPVEDTTTPPPYVPPAETTQPPYVPPVEETTTQPPYVLPVESTTPPPYVQPVESPTTTTPPRLPIEETSTIPPPFTGILPDQTTTPPPYGQPAQGLDLLKREGSISAEIERIDKAIADIDQTIQKTDRKEKVDPVQVPVKPAASSEEMPATILVPSGGETPSPTPRRHHHHHHHSQQQPTPPPEATATTTATESSKPIAISEPIPPSSMPIAVSEPVPPSMPIAVSEPVPVSEPTAVSEPVFVAGGGDDEELIKQFKRDELKYQDCPTHPKETRRMFEHPAGVHEAKVAALARFSHFMRSHNMRGRMEDKDGVCERKMIKCSTKSAYRTFDGTCNNLENPFWGSVDTPFRRIVSPAYTDGFSMPRGARYFPDRGYVSSLPSPRKISDVVLDEGVDTTTESSKNTHMLMQWGQFLDHDIIATSKEFFDCCDPKIRNLPRCFPISVPAEDSFFPQFGRTCLDFTRSNAHCDKNLKFAEQFNKQTSFIDGSVIYGNSDKIALLLRGDDERKEGKLVGNSRLANFLPSKFDLQVKNSELDRATDFVAGDKRAETQASLTSMHNLFFNEHNRIAEALFRELSLTSRKTGLELDELVYQETRKLVVAEMQQITYQEFLPQVIGLSGMAKHDLNKEECIYDPKTDPSIINSFATAAFRFGHSLVQSIFRGENQPWRLGKFYADSRFARLNNGHGYVMELLGLAKQPCQRADVHLTKQLTQELYSNNDTGHGVGHDLGSINIQRGRDHGIPAYNTFRKLCGLPPLVSLSSPPADMDPEAWSKIISVYKGVDEIDLFVGGLAEKPQDGIVGATFSCIIGRQFKGLMVGDRYFYHHTGGPGIQPLTGAALAEISKRRLSDIICESTDLSDLQASVFIQPGNANPLEPCATHRKLNIKAIAAEIKA